jgi:hypothetical protein
MIQTFLNLDDIGYTLYEDSMDLYDNSIRFRV